MGIVLSEDTHFEWDEHNIAHIAKHKVIPEEAEEVFFQEPQVITYDGKHSSEKEVRYSFLGQTKEKRLLTIIFTLRGEGKDKIRVISARDQSNKEEKEYKIEIEKGSENKT